MAKQTKTEQIIAAIIALRGAKEITGTAAERTCKYRTFAIQGDPHKFFFVGKSGALRIGSNVSNSHSLEFIVPGLLIEHKRQQQLIERRNMMGVHGQ